MNKKLDDLAKYKGIITLLLVIVTMTVLVMSENPMMVVILGLLTV